MKENEFGLNIKVKGLGIFKARFPKSLHAVKSLAGSTFHLPKVESVVVYDHKGTARLYLKKTEHGVYKEER